jgi:ubiquitin-activating enzyme E1
MFTDRAQDALNFIENPTAFLAGLRQNTTSSGAKTQLEEIGKILKLKQSANFSECVQVARDNFDEHFDHKIRDLLAIFPKDHLDSHGQPFWSGPKRAPEPISFNANDTTHLSFVMACANLVAFNLGIPQNRDRNQVQQIAASQQGKPYIKKTLKVETPEEAKAREEAKLPPPKEESTPDDEDAVQALMAELTPLAT